MTRLEQLRLDAGLSRRELAHRTGAAPVSIGKVEEGKPVQVSVLAKLSTYFGVPASSLVMPALPVAPGPGERAA